MAGMDEESLVLPLVIPLREGGPLTLESDRLTVPGLSLPIREIAWAGVVPDRPLPAASGEPSVPGIGVLVRSGDAYFFVPSDTHAIPHLLASLRALRPALASTPAPMSGTFAGRGFASLDELASIFQTANDDNLHSSRPLPTEARVLAAVAHASIAFAPVIVPFAVWLAARRNTPWTARQAKEACIWQGAFLVFFIAWLSWPVVMLYMFFHGLADISQSDIARVPYLIVTVAGFGIFVRFSERARRRAWRGEDHHYPLLGRL
jgi:uncharacterized Tic20 family protein